MSNAIKWVARKGKRDVSKTIEVRYTLHTHTLAHTQAQEATRAKYIYTTLKWFAAAWKRYGVRACEGGEILGEFMCLCAWYLNRDTTARLQ